MMQTKQLPVKDLVLDLKNFRTVEQPNEMEAVKAMISIGADRFWALMESLLDDGYLPTENIIVIKDGVNANIVKEGNRRIAALKIIHGLIDATQLGIPSNITTKINSTTPQWKETNKKVPCTLFDSTDSAIVDKIVRMAHGKGEKASRDGWPSIAKARHNRDINGVSEPGLDLLEKYLKSGQNLTGQQKERWAGDYQISVLDATIQKLLSRLNVANSSELANNYPSIPLVNPLESIMLNIGLKLFGFELLRNPNLDFALAFGFPPLPPPPLPTPPAPPTPTPSNPGTPQPSAPTPPVGTPNPPPTPTPPATPPLAPAINTPKNVIGKLKLFRPRGANREKVVTLRDEIIKLDITKTPIAFCFLLRSLFEISAKAYCIDKSIPYQSNNKDRKLIDLLRDVKTNITGGQNNHPMLRPLHGALTQLEVPTGILSVTSMNALVHNPAFSVTSTDICTLFNNIYPLLEAMN